MFYGSGFHRPLSGTTKAASWLPVAFLFAPKLLESVARYFPFDTGAVSSGKFGPWSPRLTPFEPRFVVAGRSDFEVPCKLVRILYGTNDDYLKGKADAGLQSADDPLPLLHEFLTSDLTDRDVDARQCAIECQFESDVRIDDRLLWVGLPQQSMSLAERFYRLCRPWVPDFYPYESHAVFRPNELAALLEAEALKFARKFR